MRLDHSPQGPSIHPHRSTGICQQKEPVQYQGELVNQKVLRNLRPSKVKIHAGSLQATRKDRLAIIVFIPRPLRYCSEFYASDFLVLDQEASPATVVFTGSTAFQK